MIRTLSPSTTAPSLILVIVFLSFFNTSASGQTPEDKTHRSSPRTTEVEVPVIHRISSRGRGFAGCKSYARSVSPVVTEEVFRTLIASDSEKSPETGIDRCTFLNDLEVDFQKQTVLRYRVNGDCFIRAKAALFRDDSTRQYVLRITRIYGGCRAAGTFEEWLVVEKFQTDYEVKVEVHKREENM